MITSSRDATSRPVRARRVLATSLALLFIVTALVAPAPAAGSPRGEPAKLDHFLWALAQQESGGDYEARNRVSGAYGKYQIMPFNWPNWSRRYLGDGRAKPTPRNQEIVARGKIIGLYRWLGSYRLVAHWWLTGSSDRDERRWSAYSLRYVNNIMSLMRRAPGTRANPPRGQTARPPGTGAAPRPDASKPATRTTTGWLNFRGGPGVWSPKIGPALRPGLRLVVVATKRIETGRLWLKVRLPSGRVGWVSSRYTRV